MLREPHVLVVSTGVDASTDEVVSTLARRGIRTTRLDTEQYPFEQHLTTTIGGSGQSALPTDMLLGTTSVADASALWYRRVRTPVQPSDMSAGVYDFCLREARAALIGAILSHPARVMSAPARVWAAEQKVFQLAAAKEAGLLVPDTVVTNDPQAIRGAFDRFGGQMIAKPARSGFIDYGTEQHAIFTSKVLEEHLVDLSGAHLSPTILQPLIAKRCDVRATFVGDALFVAEIDSQSDPAARIDWRQTDNPRLPHRSGVLPPAVEAGARRLMRQLGLSFGALDFIQTPDNNWIFLEVNPNGQWLWIDDMLHLGITDEIATWLAFVEP